MGKDMSFNQAEVKFERLTELNFHENSLDSFVRHQDVTQRWRKVEDEWLRRLCSEYGGWLHYNRDLLLRKQKAVPAAGGISGLRTVQRKKAACTSFDGAIRRIPRPAEGQPLRFLFRLLYPF